jgi:diguanylate cyclase (GGDEF)-like protein
MSSDPKELVKTRSRHSDGSEDSLSPAMEELALALAPVVPDPALRLTMVSQCFRLERDAPYVLALQALTGAAIASNQAAEVWQSTLETQRRWSERLGEVVSLKSAAIEAIEQSQSRHKAGQPEPDATGSIRDYLERDLVTGLYPRAACDVRLRGEVARASATQPLTLVFLQLDGIAALARSHGESVVEDVYRNVGETLRHHFRATDIPCRYGADYFMVLMPAATAARAHTLAEGLLPALQQTLRRTPVTASIGLAVCPNAGSSPSALENAAAAALNDARARGPWTIVTFTPPYAAPEPVRSLSRIAGLATAIVLVGAAMAGGCAYLSQTSDGGSGAASTSDVSRPAAAYPSAGNLTQLPPQNRAQQIQAASRRFAPGENWDGTFDQPIVDYFKRHGKKALGKPYNNGPGASVHTWNAGEFSAKVQDFKGGTHKELDVFITSKGPLEINNVHGLWTYYAHTGGLGHYGVPLNNEHSIARGLYRQDFQISSLIWSPASGVWEQRRSLGAGL